MGAISAASVRRNEAQLRPKQLWTETMDSPAPTIRSTSTPYSTGGVTLEAIMDACLDTFTNELYQVNTRVGHIAERQAHMGGFAASPTPSPFPKTSEDKDAANGNDDGEDKVASFSSDEEMTTSQ